MSTPAVSQRVDAFEQVAHDAFDRGACDLLSGHVGAKAGEGAGRIGPVRGPLAVEVGDEHDAAGAGLGGECERVETVVVAGNSEQPRDCVGGFGGVEGAHERQELAGRVGEAGDGAGRICGRLLAATERRATRAEAEYEVAWS